MRWRVVGWPLAAILVAVVAPLSLYSWRGMPAAVGIAKNPSMTPNSVARVTTSAAGSTQSAGSMDVVLKGLEQRLASKGGSDADWQLLSQTYDYLGRRDDAALARNHQLPAAQGATVPAAPAVSQPIVQTAQTQKLLADANKARLAHRYAAAAQLYQQLQVMGALDGQAWADYADVSASLNGGRLSGEPERQVDTALSMDPSNEKALWLKASAQHEQQHYAEAVATWQRLLQLTTADSSDAKIFSANLKEDQTLAGSAPLRVAATIPVTSSASQGTDSASSAVAPRVSGEVALSDSMRSRVPAGVTLFIVAKSIDSPGAPVAVVRTVTGQWPVHFELDDGSAMLPGHDLSSAGRVTVEARVSRTGTALGQPDDVESATTTVDPRAHPSVHLLIDRVLGGT